MRRALASLPFCVVEDIGGRAIRCGCSRARVMFTWESAHCLGLGSQQMLYTPIAFGVCLFLFVIYLVFVCCILLFLQVFDKSLSSSSYLL